MLSGSCQGVGSAVWVERDLKLCNVVQPSNAHRLSDQLTRCGWCMIGGEILRGRECVGADPSSKTLDAKADLC